jgi:hypothetical protein
MLATHEATISQVLILHILLAEGWPALIGNLALRSDCTLRFYRNCRLKWLKSIEVETLLAELAHLEKDGTRERLTNIILQTFLQLLCAISTTALTFAPSASG